MPTQNLNFNVSYTVDSELIWSVEEYLVDYLTDIPLRGLACNQYCQVEIAP